LALLTYLWRYASSSTSCVESSMTRWKTIQTTNILVEVNNKI
jgi:hypothetical protein